MADTTEVRIRSTRTGEQRSIAAAAVPFFIRPDGEFELVDDDLPALNDTTEAWQGYATDHGMPDELAAAKSRTELIQYFAPSQGDETPNPAPEG